MIKKIENYDRKELFDWYNECDNPFIYLTTNIDVTNVVNITKEKKVSFYATIGYLVTKAVNKVENFKYRFSDGDFYYCDRLRTNYTIKVGEKIDWFALEDIEDFEEYLKSYHKKCDALAKGEEMPSSKLDEIWVSCVPWFSFSGLLTPFRKSISMPQFIWDKYQEKDGLTTMNLMIMVHHGFADGSHIAKFIDVFNECIKNFLI